MILHVGDINKSERIDRLEKCASVKVVRSNNDKEWAAEIPEFLDMSIHGLRIYMAHNKKDFPADCSSYDLFRRSQWL